MPYEQFELKLSGDRERGFFAEVLHAPKFRRTDPFPIDLPFEEIRRWRAGLAGHSVTQQATFNLGKRLYNALFGREILRLWESSLAGVSPGGGLRLRLDIRSPELTGIPWEIMHDGFTYLALTVTTPIVRCLSHHRPARVFDTRTLPNVLLVTSSPSNAVKLPNLEIEVASITRSLSRFVEAGRLGSCDVLNHATRQLLQHRLSRANYDIVHFIGHGVFDGQNGYLDLEDESGRIDRVDSTTLGQFLIDTSMRLLFLNSCETAFPSATERSRATAEASLAVGIPEVVAMSGAVIDSVASRFAQVFYENLIDDRSIEYCMTQARKSITHHVSPYWVIPVLFTNATDVTLRREQRPRVVIEQST